MANDSQDKERRRMIANECEHAVKHMALGDAHDVTRPDANNIQVRVRIGREHRYYNIKVSACE